MILDVTSPAFGPAAVGRRDDGKVVMVTAAVPGDRVRVSVVRETTGFVQARIEEILQPSPHRREPPCAQHPACSGCDWMSTTLSAQRSFKQEVLAGALRRFASEGLLLHPVRTAGSELGYRQRARLHIESHSGCEMRIGFFREGTHDLHPIRECPVCRPELSRVVSQVAHTRAPADFAATMELVSDDSGNVMAALFLGQPHPDPAALAAAFGKAAGLSGCQVVSPRGKRGEWGMSHSTLSVYFPDPQTACTIPVFPAAFCQANREVNREMVAHVVRLFQQCAPAADVLELYAGHGNLTYPLAAMGHSLTAVEVGIRRELLPPHERVKWVQGDAAGFVRQWVRMGRTPSALLLDPPREGASTVMPMVPALRPRFVAYVSCDPSTFARDAQTLAANGYALREVTPFDMMPNTHHVELVGWFVHRPATRETSGPSMPMTTG